MWPMVAAQVAQPVVGGLLSWFNRRKVPRAHETATGREYLKRSVEGVYGPEEERRILNTAGRMSGSAAQRATAGIRGGLIRRGMDDSIAGAGLQARPQLARIGYMSDVGEQMAVTDEQAKSEAGLHYAGYKDRVDEDRRAARREALQGLFSGITGGAVAGVKTHAEEKSLAGMEDFNKKYAAASLLLESGDEEGLQRFLQEFFPEYSPQYGQGGTEERHGPEEFHEFMRSDTELPFAEWRKLRRKGGGLRPPGRY